MLALAASVFVQVAPPGRPRWQVAAVTAVAATLAVWGVWVRAFGISSVRADEARYVAAGRHRRRIARANAVILSNQHSGSLRYYAGRITMRFEWLDPDMYVPGARVFRAAESPGVCRSGRLGARDLQVALCGCGRPLVAGPSAASAGRRTRVLLRYSVASVTECALDTPCSRIPLRRSGQERATRWAIMKKRSKRLTANGFLRAP